MNSELIAFAAFGDWHESVPKGHVAVSAGNPKRYFLVPTAEYKAGMAIDTNRHAELKNAGVARDPAPAEAGLGRALPWSEVVAKVEASDKRSAGDNHGWKRVVAQFNAGAR